MKLLTITIYYQLLIFFRAKQSVFLIILFPIMLFIVFSSIWGANDSEYAYFILSGVIGMTLVSEGLFSIGPLVKNYYYSRLVSYLKKCPHNPLIYIIGLIISRIIVMIGVCIILIIVSTFFNVRITLINVINIISGIFFGFIIFSFLGLSFSFSDLKKSSGKSITNFFQFFVLFLSETFYPLKFINSNVGKIGDFLPLNPILELMRSGSFNELLILWLALPILIYIILFNRIKINR